jgi:flagellar hook protein FlgE
MGREAATQCEAIETEGSTPMSINSAMLAGASGMRANSSALAAISDNIANVNTVGYKRLRSDFTALLNSQNQLTTHNAGGVTSAHTFMMSEQGSSQASSVSTHLAISGNGFFTVRARGEDATPGDPYYFTRAGTFQPDADGFLRNAGGYYLQGWPIQPDGTLINNPTALNLLEPVRVAGIAGDAEQTTSITLAANLNSSLPVSPAAATYNAATNNMASGAVTPDFEMPIQIYDSLGGVHTLSFAFLKVGANSWRSEIFLPDAEVIAAAPLANGQLAAGLVNFTPYGQFDLANSTLPSSIQINANGTAGAPQWAANLGLAGQTIALDFGGNTSLGGLTNFDSQSVLGTSQVNGTPFGALASVDVDDDGFVTAIFTNGLTRQIYQVPVASFSNPEGLVAEQGGVFRLGVDTGPLSLRAPGTAGVGDLKSRALESSTVDLAEEFSALIMTQRAYSASSKIITTADEMLDELIRLKR